MESKSDRPFVVTSFDVAEVRISTRGRSCRQFLLEVLGRHDELNSSCPSRERGKEGVRSGVRMKLARREMEEEEK